MTDSERLVQILGDRRDSGAAFNLANEAFKHYDPEKHKLSFAPKTDRAHDEISYPEFFRRVAFTQFQLTRNVSLAARMLHTMIEERDGEAS